MPNQLTCMAKELLLIEEDLPFRLNYSHGVKTLIDDFELYTFKQVWGSTALGFGGLGGQQMTAARTYVFIPDSDKENCYVYFGPQFAYAVPFGPEFMKDVQRGKMRPVATSAAYRRKDNISKVPDSEA